MNNRLLFIPILLTLTFCAKKETVFTEKFNVGEVGFEYSSDWKFTKLQGIDSYIAYLSKDEDTIWIEYGSYNPKIYKEPLKDHIFMQIPIDSTEALFETSRNNYGGFASVYIPITDSAQGLYMRNKNGDIQQVLDIFKTLKLNNSARKKPLIIEMENFKTKSSPPGIVFYENNCLNCHSEYRYIIAPALDKKFVKSKGKVWFEHYLYSEKEISRDKFQTRCTQIPKKDSAIANEILKYLF